MFEIVEDSVAKNITAPVKAGEVLGQAKVYYAGTELATVNLVAAQTVERSFTGFVMSKISAFVGSTFFMLITILLFLAAAAYLAVIMSKFYGWDKNIAKFMAERNKTVAGKTDSQKAPAKKIAVKKNISSGKTATKKQPTKNIKK